MKNILLEGKPGTGKTTLMLKIADGISSKKIGGFYTREIRENNIRVGFSIDTFDGLTGILSHINFKEDPRVGKYGVDLKSFEEIGVYELRRSLLNSDVILIDEIGKMELFSESFKKMLIRCLDSDKPVIATIMSRSHPSVDEIKKRDDVEIVSVTQNNRNDILNRLIALFENH